jgi:S1-C subfamily serine protease
VTQLDLIILGVVALLAVYGWLQGFVAGALGLAGFALGAYLGTRFGPLVLPDGARSPYAPLFGLAGALLAGAVLAGGFSNVGLRLRRALRIPGIGVLDGLLGALLTAAIGLGVAWVLGAIAAQAPPTRQLRGDIQRSEVLRRLNAILPPSGGLLNSLARFDPFPRISGPPVRLPPPRAGIARDGDVRSARASVVKVLGTACGLGVAGSGWVARDGLVVTNAHVVAGQEDTRVLAGGKGRGLAATVVAYDPRNDVAVLRVAGLGLPSLPLASSVAAGTAAAILGYPGNGPYDVRAGRVGQTVTALTQDAYGRGPLRRRLTAFRGRVRSGNSGGPVVDGRGRVVTTVFAATRSGAQGGYGVPNALVRRALSGADRRVSTGPCAE